MKEIKNSFKGKTVVLKLAEPRLYIESDVKAGAMLPIDFSTYSNGNHIFLSNKSFVLSLYNASIEALKATPKNHYTKMPFKALVAAMKHVVTLETYLQELRSLNGTGPTLDKAKEEISYVIRGMLPYSLGDGFSVVEKQALHIVSKGRVGQAIDRYDFENVYNPLKDDDAHVKALFASIKAYDFIKIADQDVDAFKAYNDTLEAIATFRTMRDIAGNDAVNWGDHKWASQVKRAGVASSYAAKHWFFAYAESLIKKGITPEVKKASLIERLKASDAPLAQDDFVRLFKAACVRDAHTHIANMSAATAVSLLSMSTKNVTEKLDSTNVWDAIIKVIASASHPVEYATLIDALKKNSVKGTWELHTNNLATANTDDVLATLPHHTTALSKEFYDGLLASLPVEKLYDTHGSITEAFLRYAATDADKLRILASNDARIDYEISAKHFFSLPYPAIKTFLVVEDLEKVKNEWSLFASVIVANKDLELARIIATQSRYSRYGSSDDAYYDVFNMLSYDDKVEILKQKQEAVHIDRIFSHQELVAFAPTALMHEYTCAYVSGLSTKELNAAVVLADVTARLLNTPLYFNLDDAVAKRLSKDAAARFVARAVVPHTYVKKTALYAKLSREELLEAINMPITEHEDAAELVHHMTQAEIDVACKNKSFFRRHVDKASLNVLEAYKNKAAFTALVGDRRNRSNDYFARAIEARLEMV